MIIGIDVGGTTTKLGLVSDGRVVARRKMSTTGHIDEHAFTDALADEVRSLHGKPKAIGIGAPNGNQLTGSIERAPNMPWKHDVPLAQMIQECLKVPCSLGNDANAAALGEWKYGAGRGCNDLLVVTLGTGLGSGFIANGSLLLGPRGNAGELGHATLVIDGRMCTCGRRGCLEAYASIRGMIATLMELSSGDQQAQVEAPNDVMTIADRANAGDPLAVECYQRTAQWLATGLANAVTITAPERIILCGGIARSGELLMAPLREAFDAALLTVHEDHVALLLGELPEDDAGILGAAAFAQSPEITT